MLTGISSRLCSAGGAQHAAPRDHRGSAAGGSAFDEMLERSAGLQAIVDAINSTHPLVSEIGGSTHIMHAQDDVRKWF